MVGLSPRAFQSSRNAVPRPRLTGRLRISDNDARLAASRIKKMREGFGFAEAVAGFRLSEKTKKTKGR